MPALRKAVLLERGGLGFSRDAYVPAYAWSLRPGSAEDSTRQAAPFASGRIAIGGLAVYHAVAYGHKVGGSRKAPRVGALSPIEDKSLRVGGLMDEGWGLQPEREQGPLKTLEGLRQHTTTIGGKQEQPRGGVVSPASRRARGLPPSPWLRISVESCIRSRNLTCCMQGVHRKASYGIG